MASDNSFDESTVARAILALLIEQRAQRESKRGGDSVAVEEILASAGLSYQQIAPLVGKKPDAVRMLLNRKGQGAANKD